LCRKERLKRVLYCWGKNQPHRQAWNKGKFQKGRIQEKPPHVSTSKINVQQNIIPIEGRTRWKTRKASGRKRSSKKKKKTQHQGGAAADDKRRMKKIRTQKSTNAKMDRGVQKDSVP